LAYLLQSQRDAVGLSVFSDKILYKSQIKSTAVHINELFNTLRNYLKDHTHSKETNLVHVLHQVAEETPRRSLIIIFTDLIGSVLDKKEELFNAMKHLKHNKHEILLFHMADRKTEIDFIFDEKPYLYEDIETGEKIKLNPSQIQAAYRKEVKMFLDEIKWKCGQFHIDFVSADIHQDFKQVLLPFLSKRKNMF
jgi:uncharacterized protein (DUF58 family)